MLILTKDNDRKNIIEKRGIFRGKRKAEPYLKRKRKFIEGKLFYEIKINDADADGQEFKSLIKAFKGRIILSEGVYSGIPAEYLFDGKYYLIRAFLSSLIKILNQTRVTNRNVFISMDSFFSSEELFALVKSSKRIVFLFNEMNDFYEFREQCYCSFGAVVGIASNKAQSADYDFFIDFSGLSDNYEMRVIINGFEKKIYPDNSYLKGNEGIEELTKMGVDPWIAAAVINT